MDRNRRIALALLGIAAIGWLVVAVIAVGVNPLADPGMGLVGALALGFAAAVTAGPIFWLVGYARQRRIAYRGDWQRAIRRGAWVGVLLSIFVVMRLNDIFQVPIALFLIALALVAEVTLTAGSARGS
jgi:ABC-type Fe3+-siderophore transport system permease subunit